MKFIPAPKFDNLKAWGDKFDAAAWKNAKTGEIILLPGGINPNNPPYSDNKTFRYLTDNWLYFTRWQKYRILFMVWWAVNVRQPIERILNRIGF